MFSESVRNTSIDFTQKPFYGSAYNNKTLMNFIAFEAIFGIEQVRFVLFENKDIYCFSMPDLKPIALSGTELHSIQMTLLGKEPQTYYEHPFYSQKKADDMQRAEEEYCFTKLFFCMNTFDDEKRNYADVRIAGCDRFLSCNFRLVTDVDYLDTGEITTVCITEEDPPHALNHAVTELIRFAFGSLLDKALRLHFNAWLEDPACFTKQELQDMRAKFYLETKDYLPYFPDDYDFEQEIILPDEEESLHDSYEDTMKNDTSLPF